MPNSNVGEALISSALTSSVCLTAMIQDQDKDLVHIFLAKLSRRESNYMAPPFGLSD